MVVCFLVCPRLFSYLSLFDNQAYKGRGVFAFISSFPSSPFHHHYSHQTTMSSPSPAYTSFPFSYREDGPAPDIVESMEEVGGPASLSLN